ncbi:type I restriction enzyme HsdR N-terminal domain-containing protein [Ekhidna sp.]
MQTLKLPEFEANIKGNTIFCLIRRKWIILTPEEWVRQHFLNLLITHLGYPKGMMRLEQTLSYFRNQKRSDITILDKDGNTYLLVECKSPDVKLDQKVVNQVSEYNKVLNSKYLAITNGLSHFIWERGVDGFIQKNEFPSYPNQ